MRILILFVMLELTVVHGFQMQFDISDKSSLNYPKVRSIPQTDRNLVTAPPPACGKKPKKVKKFVKISKKEC